MGHENKVVSVPVYHFHDPFIKFNNVLEGKYPRKIDKDVYKRQTMKTYQE